MFDIRFLLRLRPLLPQYNKPARSFVAADLRVYTMVKGCGPGLIVECPEVNYAKLKGPCPVLG
jgi:hypothetical protein